MNVSLWNWNHGPGSIAIRRWSRPSPSRPCSTGCTSSQPSSVRPAGATSPPSAAARSCAPKQIASTGTPAPTAPATNACSAPDATSDAVAVHRPLGAEDHDEVDVAADRRPRPALGVVLPGERRQVVATLDEGLADEAGVRVVAVGEHERGGHEPQVTAPVRWTVPWPRSSVGSQRQLEAESIHIMR